MNNRTYSRKKRVKTNGRYCVVIPAYNTEGTIAELVKAIKTQQFTPVVVNDGSTDATPQKASDAGAIVLSQLSNHGKGTALRLGFKYALDEGFDGVVTLDGDGQHDPRDIPKLLIAGEKQHAGIVLGNRLENTEGMPSTRIWTNKTLSKVISNITKQDIPDSQCGMKMIRKEVLDVVNLLGERYETETELLIKASRKKWKIISVPIKTSYDPNQPSHIRPVRDSFRLFRILFMCMFS